MATLQAKIMRRVWYSYVLSLVASRAVLRGLTLGVSVAIFFTLVSVHVIVTNFLVVPVGAVPTHVWHLLTEAFVGGKFLELLTLGVIVFSLLSLGIPRPRTPFGSRTAQTI
jgi:hypothetical protein